jgi:hypothetical protein
MRTWNLSSLNELENTVALNFDKPARKRSISAGAKVSRVKSGFTIVVAAAAVSAVLLMQTPQVSSASVSVESAYSSVAQSIPRLKPPLANIFEGRFVGGWSQHEEDAALGAMSKTKHMGEVGYDEEELVAMAHANQQEDFEGNVPRLPSSEIRQIIRKRRS